MRRLLLFWLLLGGLLSAQEPPRLVVGIVIDQMRYDYLNRYADHYGEGGFKRLLREGYNFRNNQYDYTPTVTAPGHASIYTGTTPAVHGIIGNTWYDRQQRRMVSNVEDSTARLVGSVVENPYGLSSAQLLSPTLADALEAATGSRGRTISLSLKDRGAIQPGGQAPDAVYWYDWETSPGYFVSSSRYMKSLPAWVSRFNTLGKSDAYLDAGWEPMKPLTAYTESQPDDSPYETAIGGKQTPTFPYDFGAIKEAYLNRPGYYQFLMGIPAGNTLLREFAEEAIMAERLGKDKVTDLICISFSVPDVAGHTYGTESVEFEDIYLRLDRELAALLNTLDQKVGVGRYLLFLTSDHGALPPVSFLHDQGEPAGLAQAAKYRQDLQFYLARKYTAQDWILHFGEDQVYLNHEIMAEKGIPLEVFQQDVADFLSQQPYVELALTATELQRDSVWEGLAAKMRAGFLPGRSGDVLLAYAPGVQATLDYRLRLETVKGSVHGSGHDYDSHVPLIWFGAGIPHGESDREVHPRDIAPTVARILRIPPPADHTGRVLMEIVKE
ncbi:alkaline phosphatase family protein [Robiginitalea sp. M366]|uniref:alkaline phosphatase family protein n=1 Tax=Robiginitalea aestuariiviva TaxID=3036903 RepID=UPI00240D7C5A|nr:alkaline phosphatase family protein [Robiginitalea aestuariiviva]MDG1571261.1 alkaline phosphatase family protein [Robiginitalea aestuariiviva]